MNKQDFIIVFLSLQLLIMSISLVRAFHTIGYLEGQLHVQQMIDEAVNDAVGSK